MGDFAPPDTVRTHERGPLSGTHLRRVSFVIPNLAEIDAMAGRSEGYSPPGSSTHRAARSRSSGGCPVVLFTSQCSQRREAPPFPGSGLSGGTSVWRRGLCRDRVIEHPPAFRIEIPSGTELAIYDWLELTHPRPLPDSALVLSGTGRSSPGQEITFESLPQSGRNLAVRRGSCLQWHGYRAASLFMTSTVASRPSHVTLIR